MSGTLRAGDFFGERALITGEPRNATVRAAEDLETYVIGHVDFRAAIERSESFKQQAIRAYFARQ